MLNKQIQPVPKHPEFVSRLAERLGFDPIAAYAFMCQESTRAWTIPGAVIVLTDILPTHRAEMRAFPLDDGAVMPNDNLVKDLLRHVFDLFKLQVIYAIVPVEGADAIRNLAQRIGFKQDGVLRDHRMSPDGLNFSDDLIFSVKKTWLRSGPRLVKPPAA